MSTTSKAAYALAFQIGWFVCIMEGNTASLIYSTLFLGAHFIFLKQSINNVLWLKELLWILLVLVSGFIAESLTFSAGFIYSEIVPYTFEYFVMPPMWLLCIWVLFSLALRTCLSIVFSNPRLTYLLAIIAIPLNYYAGAQLNPDVELNSPYILNLGFITLIWIVLLWCLIHIKRSYFEDMFNAR